MLELNRMTEAEFKTAGKIHVVLILDNIRSGLNVGSIFRSADSFRIEKIFLCGITPTAEHRDVLKTALGATRTVKWAHHPDAILLIEELKREGYQILAVEQTINSVPLHHLELKQATGYALVLGHELSGVSQPVIDGCDGAVEIIQSGTKHSLNVAVCAGIVLYEFSQKLNFRNV